LWQALADILADLDQEPSGLLMDDVVVRVADRLAHQAGTPARPVTAAAKEAVLRARDFMEAHYGDVVRSEALEAVSGLDRYELARQFRRLLGTSPHRYLVLRRLDRAKRLLSEGSRLADAAADAGFADQAHLTRHFRQSFGMTPGRWMTLSHIAR
jgi:AraC-like DNA-binding protein